MMEFIDGFVGLGIFNGKEVTVIIAAVAAYILLKKE